MADAELLRVLTEKLENIPTHSISAVSLKLPEFWTRSPEVWFAKIEAQFNTRQISSDQTKYDYVLASLEVGVAEEIQSILLNPPDSDKYISIKKALLKTYGKSQAERDTELLNLNGLGDRRPTALLRKIENLNNDPATLKRALFLANLPQNMRPILAAQNITDLNVLAEAADRIYETNSASAAISSVESNLQVDAFNFKSKTNPNKSISKPKIGERAQSNICFFHTTFGMKAKKCEANCKFASLLQTSGNSNLNR